MKVYENDFTYGRDLVRKILYASVVTCVITLLLRSNPSLQLAFFVITFALFAAIFVVLYKYCRCPHCGKMIVFGVMAVTTCSRCKRNLITGKKVKKSQR